MVRYSIKHERLKVACSKTRCIVVLCARYAELVPRGTDYVESQLGTYGVSCDLQQPVWYDSLCHARAQFDHLVNA